MTALPPLQGVRVLDLTRVWSGPLAARILADFGAEVIKVEHAAARGPATIPGPASDRASFYPDNDPGPDPYNRSAAFNKLNRSKLSLTLDLAKPSGHQAFCDLAASSDVVLENYSPRVMGNLGIGFDTLSGLNDGIIFVSMPGYGLDGPMRDSVAYGSTLDAECGIASLMGYEGGAAQRLGVALPDPVAGMHAVGAILTAVIQRQKTGKGQHIDLSQLESMACFVADEVVGFQLTGQRPVRRGNRHRWMAPHGVYPCREPDTWVFVGVATDAQWIALASVLGQPQLADDQRFATIMARHQHQDDLDPLIESWTRTRTPMGAMNGLQAASVPAGAVHSAAGVHSDPHLRERGFFVRLTHPSAGTHDYPGQPIRFSETATVFRSDAPLLGQHNRAILGGLLGYPDERIRQLEAEGIIADRPPV